MFKLLLPSIALDIIEEFDASIYSAQFTRPGCRHLSRRDSHLMINAASAVIIWKYWKFSKRSCDAQTEYLFWAFFFWLSLLIKHATFMTLSFRIGCRSKFFSILRCARVAGWLQLFLQRKIFPTTLYQFSTVINLLLMWFMKNISSWRSDFGNNLSDSLLYMLLSEFLSNSVWIFTIDWQHKVKEMKFDAIFGELLARFSTLRNVQLNLTSIRKVTQVFLYYALLLCNFQNDFYFSTKFQPLIPEIQVIIMKSHLRTSVPKING